MKNINSFTFYATCPTENGIEIRQARFLNFAIEVIDIKFAAQKALFASDYGKTRIEIAGLGVFSGYDIAHGTMSLYYSFEGAKNQDKQQLVFEYNYFYYYTRRINLVPLDITSEDVTDIINMVGTPKYTASCYGNSYSGIGYVWNGIKPQSIDLKIEFDILHNTARLLNPPSKKLYKHADDCQTDNYTKVFTFA